MSLLSEKENKIEKELQSFLKKIVLNKKLHTHWLNTLSFMEYIGSRKIIKSQDAATLDRTLLQHICEETRHAFYFKNMAYKLSPDDCPNFEAAYMIKGASSEDYFQSIDHKAEEELSRSPYKAILNYLYTTWMIEERAVMLYGIYNRILKSCRMPFNLNMILHEEDHHLKTVVQMIQQKDSEFKERANRLFEYEKSRFLCLIKEWQSVFSKDKPHIKPI